MNKKQKEKNLKGSDIILNLKEISIASLVAFERIVCAICFMSRPFNSLIFKLNSSVNVSFIFFKWFRDGFLASIS